MSALLKLDAPDLENWFGDGRSPACWQREMSTNAARQERLAQACSWVDEVVETTLPLLESGPLLGSCLAELVDGASQVEERRSEPQLDKAAKAAYTKPTGRRTARKRQPFKLPHQAASEKTPTLPKTAASPSSLLHRWAGKTAAARPSAALAARPLKRPARTGKQAPLPEASQSSREWANQLVERTRERLAPDELLAGSPQPDRQSLIKPAGKRQTAPSVEAKLPADISNQWQQPLTGETVSMEVLERLLFGTAESTPTDSQTDPAMATPGRGKSPFSPAAGQRQPSSLAAGQRQSSSPSAWPQNSQERPSPFDRLSQPPTSREGRSLYRPENGQSDWRQGQAEDIPAAAQPRFAPPQLAETLPQLGPLPQPGPTHPLPVASITAERSARREAAQSTLRASSSKSAPVEELDDLARQIKQILDEESRRHGIDV